MTKLSSPATARNREPILEVLRRVLPARASVLEIASGAGEHAVFIARALPEITWQPSDPGEAERASIAAWTAETGASNVATPLALDARNDWSVEPQSFDAVVAINMIHISPWEATLGLMAGAAAALKPGGLLCTYGPYKRDGRHTAPSNEAFDVSLKSRNPSWGVRDVGDVAHAAAAHGFALDEIVEMPANNLSLIFRK